MLCHWLEQLKDGKLDTEVDVMHKLRTSSSSTGQGLAGYVEADVFLGRLV